MSIQKSLSSVPPCTKWGPLRSRTLCLRGMPPGFTEPSCIDGTSISFVLSRNTMAAQLVVCVHCGRVLLSIASLFTLIRLISTMTEEENLYSSTLLPPVTLIIDLCHYLLAGKQPKWGSVLNGNSNAGSVVEAMPAVVVEKRPAKKPRRNSSRPSCNMNLIEPSLLEAIRDLCKEQSHTDVLPLFSAHVPFRRKVVDQTFGDVLCGIDAPPNTEFAPKLEFASAPLPSIRISVMLNRAR